MKALVDFHGYTSSCCLPGTNHRLQLALLLASWWKFAVSLAECPMQMQKRYSETVCQRKAVGSLLPQHTESSCSESRGSLLQDGTLGAYSDKIT